MKPLLITFIFAAIIAFFLVTICKAEEKPLRPKPQEIQRWDGKVDRSVLISGQLNHDEAVLLALSTVKTPPRKPVEASIKKEPVLIPSQNVTFKRQICNEDGTGCGAIGDLND